MPRRGNLRRLGDALRAVTRAGFQIEQRSLDDTQCSLRVTVPVDLRYFEGHFIGDPIVPGIAQLIPIVLNRTREAWPDLGRLTSVKRLKFLGALRPGHELDVLLERGPKGVSFQILREGTVCTKGRLVFQPQP